MGKELSLEKVSEKTDDDIMAMADKDFKDATAEVKDAIKARKAQIAADRAAGAAAATAPSAAPEETKNPQAAAAGGGGGDGGSQRTDLKPKGWAAGQDGQKTLKLVLTGDTAVGKSCLITNYLNNSFTDDYEPTVLDVYKGIKNVQKKQIEIEIHDTSGDEHLGVNRKVQYKDADVFMICVAANSHESLESVARWKSEIQEIEQEKPVALILTKSDLADEIDEPVDLPMVKAKQKEMAFVMSAKTSSKVWEDFNVHKAFNRALTAAYQFKYEMDNEDQ